MSEVPNAMNQIEDPEPEDHVFETDDYKVLEPDAKTIRIQDLEAKLKEALAKLKPLEGIEDVAGFINEIKETLHVCRHFMRAGTTGMERATKALALLNETK